LQPVRADNVPILTVQEEIFEDETTGFQIFKVKVAEWSRRLIYFYVSPTGHFCYYWTCLISLGLLYNMMAMVIFIFDDVYIAYTFDGSEVKNVRMTLKNYYRSYRVYLDLLALVPTDLFLIFYSSTSLVRVVRLLKAYRLNDFIENNQKRTSFPHASKIALLMTSCYILFHWNACVYFMFSLAEGLSEDDTNAFGFSYYKVFDPRFPTCSVFNDQNCQYQENYSLLDIDDYRPKYMQEMYSFWEGKFIKWEMGNFSREYSMSIYWSALTITTCGQQELLDVLPPRLQGQIAVNLHMETLKKVELFKHCSAGFLYEVVLRIKQQIYSPNDYLFRAGERAKEMFIVKRGTLKVVDADSLTPTMQKFDGLPPWKQHPPEETTLSTSLVQRTCICGIPGISVSR
ncbi:transporter, cation channel family protein, partial [Oesophagostomum dentatum]